MSARFLAMEVLRAVRNPRYAMFSVAFPVGLFLMFAQLYGDDPLQGTTAKAYLMVSMAMFGAMGSTLGTSARIAAERQVGWNRLLRLTPLRPRAYVAARLVTVLALAVPSFLLVFAAARFAEGVQLTVGQWGLVTGYFTLALLPFAVLGIALGYLATADSAPMINGAAQMILSVFGGVWVPVSQMPHAMLVVGKALPSFWFGVAARSPLTHERVGAGGLAVLLAWTVGLALLAARRYRGDAVRA
jgi:ABC-2 type transport system permease protein